MRINDLLSIQFDFIVSSSDFSDFTQVYDEGHMTRARRQKLIALSISRPLCDAAKRFHRSHDCRVGPSNNLPVAGLSEKCIHHQGRYEGEESAGPGGQCSPRGLAGWQAGGLAGWGVGGSPQPSALSPQPSAPRALPFTEKHGREQIYSRWTNWAAISPWRRIPPPRIIRSSLPLAEDAARSDVVCYSW